MPELVNLVVGSVLLLAGRRIFWLFVAVAGFYVGLEVTRIVLVDQPQWLTWLAAVAAGAVGAIVAMLFQRVAFALGGLYAGGYIALLAAERYFPGVAGAGAFIAGGILGALAAVLIMDWAIIGLSCLVGAALVVPYLNLGDPGSALVYAGLIVVGFFIQARLLRGQIRTGTGD